MLFLFRMLLTSSLTNSLMKTIAWPSIGVIVTLLLALWICRVIRNNMTVDFFRSTNKPDN